MRRAIAALSDHGFNGDIRSRCTLMEAKTALDGPGEVAAKARTRRAGRGRFWTTGWRTRVRAFLVGGRCARFILACLTLCAVPAMSDAQDDDTRARGEKAAYLYKFAPFVDWPDPSAEFPSGAFRICVVGGQPFDGMLDRVVQGHTVGGRPIAVQQLAGVTGNPGCSVMFVAGPDAQSVAQTLAAVRGSPVLTVTDGAVGLDDSGIINFVAEDSRVRFEINPRAAAANRLTISSKLLNLATRVTGQDQRR